MILSAGGLTFQQPPPPDSIICVIWTMSTFSLLHIETSFFSVLASHPPKSVFPESENNVINNVDGGVMWKVPCGIFDQVPVLSVSHVLLVYTWWRTCTSHTKWSLHERHKLELLMTLKTAWRVGAWRAAAHRAGESWFLIWVNAHSLCSESDGEMTNCKTWDLLSCNEGISVCVCSFVCLTVASVWVILRHAAQAESSH